MSTSLTFPEHIKFQLTVLLEASSPQVPSVMQGDHVGKTQQELLAQIIGNAPLMFVMDEQASSFEGMGYPLPPSKPWRTCPDPEVLKQFQEMQHKDRLVSLSASAEKLMKLLKEDSFQDGAHIDFFDL